MTYFEPWEFDEEERDEPPREEPPMETPCFRCDRSTIGETCGGCGAPLCPQCFETSGGYHCAPKTEPDPDLLAAVRRSALDPRFQPKRAPSIPPPPPCPDCKTAPLTFREACAVKGEPCEMDEADADRRAYCKCLGTPGKPGPCCAWKFTGSSWKRWSPKARGWRKP